MASLKDLHAVVTGGAGFIGSRLVDALMASGCRVTVVDNLSSGSPENLRRWEGHPRFSFIQEDLKDVRGSWVEAVREADVVFHFAANPEVRLSTTKPRVHFEENVVATFNVLEAIREAGVSFLVFASSSAVYGEGGERPIDEDHPKRPLSVYGASKLACETLIETYHRLYGLKALALRYANIIGPRLTHGVVVDFVRKLKANPHELEILGDGTQRRSFLHVEDAVSATLHLCQRMLEGSLGFGVFNVGNEDWMDVRQVARAVVDEMGLSDVRFKFRPGTPDGRGWLGDVKLIILDIGRLKSTGWRPSLTSEEAVRRTVRALLEGQ